MCVKKAHSWNVSLKPAGLLLLYISSYNHMLTQQMHVPSQYALGLRWRGSEKETAVWGIKKYYK